jgi:hypothetical protein
MELNVKAIWNELLDEFRALGGVADNIRLDEGSLGRGLFAIDPGKPVLIRVPENLLVDSSNIFFERDVLKIARDASIGARERKFLEDYHAHLSWNGGGRTEIDRVLLAAQELPEDLRRRLLSEFHCGQWFEDYSPTLVQQQFVASRCISFKERTVLMPVLDLANHGAGGTFEVGDDIALQGVMKDEVLTRYADIDSFGVFQSWGFACPQPQAMSIALTGNVGGAQVKIDRAFGNLKSANGVWVPELSPLSNGIELNFLMTGNRQYPRLCKGIFYKIMREAGLSGYEEGFDMIQHSNRMHFLGLLAALEDAGGAMAQTLRLMARYQLETMSFSFGVRAI